METIQKENTLPQRAISTKAFDLCMEVLKNSCAGEKKKSDAIRSPIPFGYDEYKALLSQSANVILQRRRERNGFVIDEYNEPVISQIYLYLKMNDKFSGDLQKGVMLVGKYGSGKTLIMQAMSEMYNTAVRTLQVRHPILRFVKSTELLYSVKEKSVNDFSRMPLVIDELGREPKQIMDFGNLTSHMIELLCERYDNGAWTHGTSNFTLETLASENQYGKMTGDRIKSMFNFIELTGESRRK
jgi:DNA replication protein DnaC